MHRVFPTSGNLATDSVGVLVGRYWGVVDRVQCSQTVRRDLGVAVLERGRDGHVRRQRLPERLPGPDVAVDERLPAGSTLVLPGDTGRPPLEVNGGLDEVDVLFNVSRHVVRGTA